VYVGVDEAGKGPVLGPMVTAAVRADPAALPADVDDSKRVSSDRREAIAATLRDREDVSVAVATIEPADIDRPETDMNTLTVAGQASAIRDVVEPGDRVIADAADTSEERFAERLVDRLNGVADAPNATVEDAPNANDVADAPNANDVADAPSATVAVEARHGADAEVSVVGAASIVAKTTRDTLMAEIDAAHPAYDGVGSGYPSDPTTRTFLAEYVADHGELPDCARRSWSTCTDVLASVEQSGLDEF